MGDSLDQGQGVAARPGIVDAEAELAEIVRSMRTVAVVGMKDENRAEEPAHAIPRLLQERGCEVIPVNPTIARALGVPALRSVTELSRRVDVLDIFRRAEAIPPLAEEILSMPVELRPVVVWLQSGIRHDEAAARLAGAGLTVVQDRCLGVYAARYRRQAER
jgi:predicted CoA-binding protein